jgi:hypothetical protein
MLVFMLEDWRGSLRDVQGRTVSEELMQSLRKPELFKGQLVVAICSVPATGGLKEVIGLGPRPYNARLGASCKYHVREVNSYTR